MMRGWKGFSIMTRNTPCLMIPASTLYNYIEDMRTKKVNECAVTYERIFFS